MTKSQRQLLKLISAGVLLLSAAIVLLSQNSAPVDVGQRWYYDLGTGKLFLSDVNELAPIKAPSGSEGVRAHVFACGQCNDASQRKIAFLSKYGEEDKLEIKKMRERAAADPQNAGVLLVQADIYATEHLLVSGPDGHRWHLDPDGKLAQSFITSLSKNCHEGKGQTLADCSPSQ